MESFITVAGECMVRRPVPRGLSSVRIRDVAALFNGSKHRDDGFKCMSFYYDRRNQEFIATKNENNVMIKFPLSVNSSVNDQNLRLLSDEKMNPLWMNQHQHFYRHSQISEKSAWLQMSSSLHR